MSGLKLNLLTAAIVAAALSAAANASAKTVKVTLHAKEVDLPIDNKGTMYRAWTFDGKVPGPLVRVTQGDTVDFTLVNDPANKNSHAMDFHAAQLDVVKDFGSVKPGESKHYTFTAHYPASSTIIAAPTR